jgi:succinoglycan biosynthesis protein ExoO
MPRQEGNRSNPVVSVIVPAFNAEPFVFETLRSVSRQTLPHIEAVVVDDRSTDRTAEIVAALSAQDPRIRLIRSPVNGGPARARNLALAHASGTWVAALDADDLLEPTCLERLVGAATCGRAEMVASNLAVVDATNSVLGTAFEETELGDGQVIDAVAFVRGNMLRRGRCSLGHLQPMVHRAWVSAQGLSYDEGLDAGEDYHHYLDMLLRGARFLYVAEPLYRYRVGHASLSQSVSEGRLARLLAAGELSLRDPRARDSRLRAALLERQRSLSRWMLQQRFVDRLKDGRPLAALSVLADDPSVVSLVARFGMEAIGKRLGRRVA